MAEWSNLESFEARYLVAPVVPHWVSSSSSSSSYSSSSSRSSSSFSRSSSSFSWSSSSLSFSSSSYSSVSMSSSSYSRSSSNSSSSSTEPEPFLVRDLMGPSLEGGRFFFTDSTGLAYSAGSNDYYTLGNGDQMNSVRFQRNQIPSLPIWMATGWEVSFYINSGGDLYGIGANGYYQMGTGSNSPNKYTTWHPLSSTVKRIYISSSNNPSSMTFVTIKNSGEVYAWGYNSYGQLGLGDRNRRNSPVSIPIGVPIEEAVVGQYHTLFLSSSGHVYGTGRNYYGELGVGDFSNRSSPVLNPYLPNNIRSIASGNYFCLALGSDGRIWSWGYNNKGQLGDNTQITNNIPRVVSGQVSFVKIAASKDYSFAIDSSGGLWSWGGNDHGALGLGKEPSMVSSPTLVSANMHFVDLMLNSYSVIGKDHSNHIWGWGLNDRGQLGVGEDLGDVYDPIRIGSKSQSSASSSPPAISSRFRLVSVAPASGTNSGLLDPDSRLLIAGTNSYSMTADGDDTMKVLFSRSAEGMRFLDAAIGSDFICAIDEEGRAWSWGRGVDGRLGNGSTADQSSPVAVVGGLKFKKIVASRDHVLGLTRGNEVWGWGNNSSGQLGLGSYVSRASPEFIISDIKEIDVGYSRSFFVKADGQAYAAGYNGYGSLGVGDSSTKDTPTALGPAPGYGDVEFSKISSGRYHSLGIDLEDKAWGWGRGYYGWLPGLGGNFSNPTSIPGGRQYKKISCGQYHNIAIDANGNLLASGQNGSGQIGDGSTTTRSSWVSILPGRIFVDVEAHADASLAIEDNGTVWAWGSNSSGQLGIGNTASVSEPVQVARLYNTNWSSSSSSTSMSSSSTSPSYSSSSSNSPDIPSIHLGGCGSNFHWVIDEYSRLWSWGDNSYGKLGDLTSDSKSSPVSVAVRRFFIKTCLGRDFSLSLREDGRVYATGYGGYGQLGNGSTSSVDHPVEVSKISSIKAVNAGNLHSLAIDESGLGYAWGYGGYGQLGSGNSNSTTTPIEITGGHKWKMIAGGGYFTIGLDISGVAWGFGYGGDGRTGIGSTNSVYSPTSVVGGYRFKDIACGENFSLAIDESGQGYAWGYGGYGQLGSGNTGSSTSPIAMSSTNDFIKVAAGQNHSMGLTSDGNVYCWGYNSYGQLGLGDMASRSVPTRVAAFSRPIIDIACSLDSCLAMTDLGEIYSWGRNHNGSLGLGDTVDRSVPVSIPHIWYHPSSSSSSHAYSSSSSTPSDIPDGLIHRWPLDNSNGTNDVVGSINLVNNNSVPIGENGAEFDGVNKWLNANITFPTAYSLFMRVKPYSYGSMSPFLATNSSDWTVDRVGIIIDSDYDMVVYTGTSSLELINHWSESKFSPSNFTSLCLTCDGSVMKIYRQAPGGQLELMGQKNITSGRGNYLAIGRSGSHDSGYFDGFIRDISMYNRMLSPAEISVLHSKEDSQIRLEGNTTYQIIIRTDPWNAPTEDTWIWRGAARSNGWCTEDSSYTSVDNWSSYSTISSDTVEVKIFTKDGRERANTYYDAGSTYRMGRYSGENIQTAFKFTTGSGDGGSELGFIDVWMNSNNGGVWQTSDRMILDLLKYESPGKGKLIERSSTALPPTAAGQSVWERFEF